MKRILHVLLTLFVLTGLGWVLRLGFQNHDSVETIPADPAARAAHTDVPEVKPEAYTVTLDKEQARLLDLTTAKAEPLDHSDAIQTFGTVLDPTALVTLDSELAAATAALTASKASHDRTLVLTATRDASQQAAETTLSQYTADRIKLESLLRNARLQWGTHFNEDPEARHLYTERLISGSTALIRVEVLPGDALTGLPERAILTLPGQATPPFAATEIQPALTTDPKTQAQGYFLRVDQAPVALRPGMAVTAWLSLPGPPRPGFAIPRSAILRHDGRTWIYLQEKVENEEIKFTRQPVTLDTPLEKERGWFIPSVDGVTAESLIVTTGASTLLSEELKAQGAAPEMD